MDFIRNNLWIVAVAIILIVLLRTVIRYKKLLNAVNRMNVILYVDKNIDGYIEECDKMINSMKGDRNRDLNLLQKSTGLFFAGRFEEAIDILQNQLKQIPPNGQGLYYQNLILSKYFEGNVDEGHKVFEDTKEILETYRKAQSIGENIEFIYAVDDLYCGEFSEREEYFNDMGENGRNTYRQALGYYCLGVLYKKQEKLDEMKEAFDKAIETGKNSFMEKNSLKELESMK